VVCFGFSSKVVVCPTPNIKSKSRPMVVQKCVCVRVARIHNGVSVTPRLYMRFRIRSICWWHYRRNTQPSGSARGASPQARNTYGRSFLNFITGCDWLVFCFGSNGEVLALPAFLPARVCEHAESILLVAMSLGFLPVVSRPPRERLRGARTASRALHDRGICHAVHTGTCRRRRTDATSDPSYRSG
jgi:hypothetical protein